MKTIKIGQKEFQYDVLEDNTLKVIVGQDKDGKPIYKDILKLRYYKFSYNDRGYISSFNSVNKDQEYDWYGQASCFNPDLGMGCYSFEKGVDTDPVFDENEYERILVKREEEKKKQEKEAQRIPAQVSYTAMMTDTELPPDELSNIPNELSPFAQKVKMWYDMGLWTYAMVEQALQKGKITQEEFDEITKKNKPSKRK